MVFVVILLVVVLLNVVIVLLLLLLLILVVVIIRVMENYGLEVLVKTPGLYKVQKLRNCPPLPSPPCCCCHHQGDGEL